MCNIQGMQWTNKNFPSKLILGYQRNMMSNIILMKYYNLSTNQFQMLFVDCPPLFIALIIQFSHLFLHNKPIVLSYTDHSFIWLVVIQFACSTHHLHSAVIKCPFFIIHYNFFKVYAGIWLSRHFSSFFSTHQSN